MKMAIMNSISNIDFDGMDLEALLAYYPRPLHSHSRRVAVCSSIMAEYAETFMYVNKPFNKTRFAEYMHIGGTCHDIGKLLIPAIPQDDEAYKRHPAMGAEFLENFKETLFRSEDEVRIVLDMVHYHHEQPCGKGFPNGLHSKDIPLSAGICAIADAFDHFLVSNGKYIDNYVEVSSCIIDSAEDFFSEIAVICFEQALPRLVERYELWKTH